jgi:hypothetical protein
MTAAQLLTRYQPKMFTVVSDADSIDFPGPGVVILARTIGIGNAGSDTFQLIDVVSADNNAGVVATNWLKQRDHRGDQYRVFIHPEPSPEERRRVELEYRAVCVART